MSKDTAFNGETSPRHTFLCSDSQCLPPGDPRILCAKQGSPITGKSFIEIIVADCHNHRVQVFDSNGTFLRSFGHEGEDAGEFNFPVGIAINKDRNIFVAESENNRIQIFS